MALRFSNTATWYLICCLPLVVYITSLVWKSRNGWPGLMPLIFEKKLVSCCSPIPFFLFILIVVIIGATISEPKVDLRFISVPSLDLHLNSTNNSSIAFHLLLRNKNRLVGVSFSNTSVSLYVNPNRSLFLGNYTFPAFRLGKQKHAVKSGFVPTDIIGASSNRSVVFRLDLVTQFTVKVLGNARISKNNMAVGANIPINDEGTIDTRSGIKLTSEGARKK